MIKKIALVLLMMIMALALYSNGNKRIQLPMIKLP
jgi:hypothetical protein